MKTTTIKFLVMGLLVSLAFTGCSPEDDIQLPDASKAIVYADFLGNTHDGDELVLEGWTNFAEAGDVKWAEGIYYDDKYVEMNPYNSGDPSNIAWLISPAINMDLYTNEILAFDVAQAYVGSAANSLQLLVSTDFNGTDVLAAHWEPVTFKQPPLNSATNFDFFSSGIIDLSGYDGTLHFAFKYKGAGVTNSPIDGTYELDNIRFFAKNKS
ncbi:choice-of-anchor J domain-containing protein [Flavobacterium wongokense]|uniref:choice-of-anchor J domain-containing protein n=1 Tax=Flavobacterium wongokense TaxID=2910674 RepID=UPI001F292DE4|nr:choice-of-anchor J domain-containing protein [Flavobacterium sp. WG47]MCF6131364.1 DUF5017 domain-containing protein [Flavobacterium sp. WG47]